MGLMLCAKPAGGHLDLRLGRAHHGSRPVMGVGQGNKGSGRGGWAAAGGKRLLRVPLIALVPILLPVPRDSTICMLESENPTRDFLVFSLTISAAKKT